MEKAYLLLVNSEVFEGYSIGARGSTVGEVVFTTGMTGYEKVVTDPSYYGQIVVQTYPLIGNYGFISDQLESDKTHLAGYVVREICDYPSNWKSEGDFNSFLASRNVVAIAGIDTRKLTRIIRENGVMNGAIIHEDDYNDPARLEEIKKQIAAYRIENAPQKVAVSDKKVFKSDKGDKKVVVLDFGANKKIIKCLNDRGCNVTLIPGWTDYEKIIAENPDGILLSSGPGNPAENKQAISNVSKVLDQNIPVFGICLGHQIITLACGGKTFKLKYGHRGANQPVTDINRGLTYITSQNHGYVVDADSLDSDKFEITHINANDKTVEGIKIKGKPVFSVQFHPELSSGSFDIEHLFDDFVKMMGRGAN